MPYLVKKLKQNPHYKSFGKALKSKKYSNYFKKKVNKDSSLKNKSIVELFINKVVNPKNTRAVETSKRVRILEITPIIEKESEDDEELLEQLAVLSRNCPRLKKIIIHYKGILSNLEIIELLKAEHPYKYQAVIEGFYFCYSDYKKKYSKQIGALDEDKIVQKVSDFDEGKSRRKEDGKRSKSKSKSRKRKSKSRDKSSKKRNKSSQDHKKEKKDRSKSKSKRSKSRSKSKRSKSKKDKKSKKSKRSKSSKPKKSHQGLDNHSINIIADEYRIVKTNEELKKTPQVIESRMQYNDPIFSSSSKEGTLSIRSPLKNSKQLN